MEILHLNSNYNKSSIYRNMNQNFRKYLSDNGKVYFSTANSFLPDEDEKNYLDIRNNVRKFSVAFRKKRNEKLFKDITSLYNFGDFDCIIAYSLFSNGLLAYELSKKFSIPYYVIVQNTDVNVHFKKIPFSKKRGNLILENAEKVIFISESYKNEVIESFIYKKDLIASKSVVIPFGIDDFWKNNVSVAKHISNKEINLIYVGKVNKNKNISTIINVVDSLNKSGFKTKLEIIGDIESKGIYKKIKKNKSVNWRPFIQDKEELLNIYRSNDIFIMPSYKESFGLVYGEAMSQGLPVIYTKGQGFDQQFNDGEIGFSVNPNNILDIQEKILMIVENYHGISSNCIQGVEKFNWSNICMMYQNILKTTDEI